MTKNEIPACHSLGGDQILRVNPTSTYAYFVLCTSLLVGHRFDAYFVDSIIAIGNGQTPVQTGISLYPNNTGTPPVALGKKYPN